MRFPVQRAGIALTLWCLAAAFSGFALPTAVDSWRKLQVALVPEPATPATARSVVLSNDEWFRSLRSEESWSRRRNAQSAPPSTGRSGLTKQGPLPSSPPQPWSLFGNLFGPDDAPAGMTPVAPAMGRTFRTVCVRMCDGYFFPISFSTVRERFSADEATCENRCPGARLYAYRNPGEEPENMVDANGQPYGKLKTAFLYRTTYDASCKCNAHPWEQEARMRHRMYALEAERKKGNKRVVAELKELKTAIAKADASATAGQSGKGRKSRKTATASAGTAAAADTATPSQTRPQAGLTAPGGAKIADPSLAASAQRPAAQRIAESGKPLPKTMGLGNPPQPAAQTGGSDWKRKALAGGSQP